jgi:hypothetical protein
MAFGHERSDPGKLVQIDVLAYLIRKGPGRTAAELTKAIHNDVHQEASVYQDCLSLCASGDAERRGSGGPSDPFRYYPVEN